MSCDISYPLQNPPNILGGFYCIFVKLHAIFIVIQHHEEKAMTFSKMQENQEAQMWQFIKTAEALIPVLSKIEDLVAKGMSYEYLACLLDGEGLKGILKLKAAESAHKKQLVVEQNEAQEQVSIFDSIFRNLEIRLFPSIPEREWKQGEAKVLLGENAKGVIELNLESTESSHFLVGGTAGSGKTFAVLRPMVYSLLRQGCEVVVVGGKRLDYEDLINLYNLKFYENECAYDIAENFAKMCEELRRSSMDEINAKRRRVLVIDEYSSSVAEVKERYKNISLTFEEKEEIANKYAKEKVEKYNENLFKIATTGRILKHHLILATQRITTRNNVDSDGIPREFLLNFPARICLKCLSKNEGNLILPVDGDRAVSLLGRGDAIVMAGAVNERYQGYSVPA